MRNTRILILLFLVLLPLNCHRETEQDKIKAIINRIQQRVEEKDIKDVLAQISRTYQDSHGHDYDGIKGLLLYYVYRHQKVSIYIPDLEITVSGLSAKARFQAVLSGGNTISSPGDLIPEALGMYDFEVSLLKEQKDWKVNSATWEKIGVPSP